MTDSIKKMENHFKEQYEQLTYYKPHELCKCNDNIKKSLLKHKSSTQRSGFTLTFKPIYHEYDPDELYEFIVRYCEQNFHKKDPYIIFPEFTSSGILHFHGVVYNCYQRYISSCLKEWRRQYGYVKIEWTIKNEWLDYIQKDMNKTGYAVIDNIDQF